MTLRPAFKDMEDIRGFLVAAWSNPGSDVSVFAGAGISIPPPSSLPSAIDVIKNLTSALCNHPAVENFAFNLPESVLAAGVKMEALFEILQRNAGSKLIKLFGIFEEREPNLYHYFLARLLEFRAADHIITTNFDCLIERASRIRLNVRASEFEHASRSAHSLYKIHGTVDRPETMIAVLHQVSRGLPPNKRGLMVEALKRTCLVVGWSDDDIDLTPAFFQTKCGLLIWFAFDPQSPRVIDFLTAPGAEIPGLGPKLNKILRENRGVYVACDPMALFLTIWHDLEALLGSVPVLESAPRPDIKNYISTWAESLTLIERLLIVGDILHYLTRWNEAQMVFRQAESLTTDSDQLFNIHNKLGLCFTHLSVWRDAFQYFDLCLADKGYKATIEVLIEERPGDDPQLAVLYGNVGTLLRAVGRIHDSAICHEQDVAICERFSLGGGSLACANLASTLGQLGDFPRAKQMAEKAAAWGLEEGNIVAIEGAHQELAHFAAVTGDWERAEAELALALDIANMLGRPDSQIHSLTNFARHYYTIGEIQAALRHFNTALNLAEHYNLTDEQAELWMTKGVIEKEAAILKYPVDSLHATPEMQESLAAYNRSLELLAHRGTNQKLKSIILTNRGLLFHLLNDNKRALHDLWESLKIRTSLMDEIGQATILNNLAIVLLNGQGGADQAKVFLLKALSIYDYFGHKVGRCQVLHDLAGVYIVKLHEKISTGKLQRVKRSYEYKKALEYLNESLLLAKALKIPAKIKQAEHNLRMLNDLGS